MNPVGRDAGLPVDKIEEADAADRRGAVKPPKSISRVTTGPGPMVARRPRHPATQHSRRAVRALTSGELDDHGPRPEPRGRDHEVHVAVGLGLDSDQARVYPIDLVSKPETR